MKFSEQWLRQWVNPGLSTEVLGEKLTMAGLEVDAITPLGLGLQGVVIGQIISAESHPNADRLRLCQVEVAANQPLQIVCGAANARVGIRVAVAVIGAELPNGLKIKAAKIRGVESQGMLCSTSELGLTEHSDGIMELPLDAPLGKSLPVYLELPDRVFDVSITPNRGDCLSIAGIAREIGAICDCETIPRPASSLTIFSDIATPSLTVIAEDACPRYYGRVIQNLNLNAITPLWLQHRLQRAGLRSIHPIVDITNYVMLEYGQPLHAFDLRQITGDIRVRYSMSEESVTLLDGQTLTLTDTALVIADSDKILALAGIMGSADSAVQPDTTAIFLESAFFVSDAICPTLRRFSVHSDAAYRFERGVDPQLAEMALARATELLCSIVGGQAGEVCAHFASNSLAPKVVSLRYARIHRVLGVTLPPHRVEAILQRLGMQLQPLESFSEAGWLVTIPSYRFDLALEIDLIEEIARIYGYDHIPANRLSIASVFPILSEHVLDQERLRAFWLDRGYDEAINYSFISPELAEHFDPERVSVSLRNPISVDLSVMRTTLWAGLIEAARFNLNRQQNRLRLFEVGSCFRSDSGEIQQTTKFGGLCLGAAYTEQWGYPERSIDFFDVKGDIEAWFELSGRHYPCVTGKHPALHPGQTATWLQDEHIIGYLGALHPRLQKAFGIPVPVYLFEFDLCYWEQATVPRYEMPSKFPSMRRDLAFTLPETVAFADIHASIHSCVGEVLQGIQLFDIYRGQMIAVGDKSLALGLIFQLASRTLTDSEVDEAVTTIVQMLERKFKAVLRK